MRGTTLSGGPTSAKHSPNPTSTAGGPTSANRSPTAPSPPVLSSKNLVAYQRAQSPNPQQSVCSCSPLLSRPQPSGNRGAKIGRQPLALPRVPFAQPHLPVAHLQRLSRRSLLN